MATYICQFSAIEETRFRKFGCAYDRKIDEEALEHEVLVNDIWWMRRDYKYVVSPYLFFHL